MSTWNMTQRRLIADAEKNGGCGSIECGGGRGARGGRVRYGVREGAAVAGLEAAGVVRVTLRDTSQHWPGNGAVVSQTLIRFELVKNERQSNGVA